MREHHYSNKEEVMAQEEIANWILPGGGTTPFNIYYQNQGWHNVAGVYIFAMLKEGRWQALYIGQAASFSDRLPGHERLDEAVKLGATAIHARVVPGQPERDMLERALIGQNTPPMNEQHNPRR